MLARHGHVIAEGWWSPYDASSNHELYSLSKSFTSTAVGLAVAEGKLSVDDPILSFFPEESPAEPGAHLKAMRIRDLLSMSAGHQDETPSAADKISARAFLAHPVPHKPGTHFKYNTPATFMLSAILQKQTGQTVLDYLRPRLFEPLGMASPVWNTNWQGISLGGYGLRVRTEDIASLAQLYLQKGRWQSTQLIPAAWVEAASSRQTSNGSNPDSDWDQGYGFQFWRCRHGAYRGDGAFGQYCLVLPDQDAVVAITSGVKNMQAVLDLIWDELLPAFQSQPLPPSPREARDLKQTLAQLVLAPAEGNASSSLTPRLMGHRFVFPANERQLEAVSFKPLPSGAGTVMTLRVNGVETEYACGFSAWKKGRGPFANYPDEPVAGTVGWVGDDMCVVKLCAYETPYTLTLRWSLENGQLHCDSETNVGFGRTKQPRLAGRPDDQP
jgi:CubicO group peptidase (beta-lactamase class C family)